MEMTCGTWIFPAAAMLAWFSPPVQLMGEMETMVVVPFSVRLANCCCCCCTSLPAWLWKCVAGEARGATGTSWGHWDPSWETGTPWTEGTTCGREKTCEEELQEEMTEVGRLAWVSDDARTTYSTCGVVAEVGVAGDTEEEEEAEVRTSEGMALDGEEEEEDGEESLSGMKSTAASHLTAFLGTEEEMTDGRPTPDLAIT